VTDPHRWWLKYSFAQDSSESWCVAEPVLQYCCGSWQRECAQGSSQSLLAILRTRCWLRCSLHAVREKSTSVLQYCSWSWQRECAHAHIHLLKGTMWKTVSRTLRLQACGAVDNALFQAHVEESVYRNEEVWSVCTRECPVRKKKVRPRSSSDVNMSNQTEHSGRIWAQHQGNIGLNAVV